MSGKEVLFVNHAAIRDIQDTEYLNKVRTFVARRSRTRQSRFIGSKISPPHGRTQNTSASNRDEANQPEASQKLEKKHSNSLRKQTIGHPAIDSICSIPINLDEDKHSVLEYFTKLWMPSEKFIPPGCNVGGFTPLAPKDSAISRQIVSGAMQAESDLHIYALLAFAGRRMQRIDRIQTHQQKGTKDLYTLKAIQALRQHLLLNQKINDRLVLDLSFLALNEFFGPLGARQDVYWQMMQHFVIACGGFTSIDLFTAHFCVAADVLIAATTLTPPTFDFLESPELLGLKISAIEQQGAIQDMVIEAISNFPPRLRVACLESVSMTDFITTVRRLPVPAVDGITGIISENAVLLYRLLVMASIPRMDLPENPGNSHQAMTADGLAFHSRFLAYKIWLWYSALKFLDQETVSHINTGGTCPVSTWVSEMFKSLDRALGLFLKTSWAIREDLVLWMSALGILISTDAPDLISYIDQFRSIANSIGIDGPDHLQGLLAPFPPLDRVRTNRMDRLWLLLQRADGTWSKYSPSTDAGR